jgi:sulfate adenylyltransferase subunit 1
MDLVSFSEEVYQNIVKVYEEFASKLEVKDIRFIPISALKGDNVVNRSNNMDWYQGATLMHNLETIHIGSDENHTDARFPIQTVIRPHSDAYHDFRGYAGRIDGGIFRVGEEIVVLPSGKRSTIKEIFLGDRSLIECFAPMSVSMTLNDDIDISRGNIIAKVNNQPEPSKEFEIAACWFHDKPLNPNTKYIIRQGTSEVFGKIEEIIYKMEITTLTRNLADKFIGINDIFKAKIRVSQDLFVDSYHRNRKTGSLIVIDQTTNETIAVGMIS